VRQALARLSPGHRDVIEQLYLYGCTASEAAARLGIPEGTVFSRSYYAMRILRFSTEKSRPLPVTGHAVPHKDDEDIRAPDRIPDQQRYGEECSPLVVTLRHDRRRGG
jgi:hypothetical protein